MARFGSIIAMVFGIVLGFMVCTVQAEPAPASPPPVAQSPSVASQGADIDVSVPANWQPVGTRTRGPYKQTMFVLGDLTIVDRTNGMSEKTPRVVASVGPVVESIESMVAANVEGAKGDGYVVAATFRSPSGSIVSTKLTKPDGSVVVISMRSFPNGKGTGLMLIGWLQKEDLVSHASQMQKVLLDAKVVKK